MRCSAKDGAPALQQLPFQSRVSEEDAKEIVTIFKEAGANLDVRSSKMCASETPLHIACTYGVIAVVKALVEAGAQVNIMDDRGRIPVDNAKKALQRGIPSRTGDPQACIDYLQEKARSGVSTSNNKSEAQLKRGEKIRNRADRYYKGRNLDKAAEEYTKLLNCLGDDAVVYANLAATYNRDAVERWVAENGRGFRQKFKDTYENSIKVVELEPSYERGWILLVRGYLGYRELPRAKKAAKDGYLNCPSSAPLKEIWDALNAVGIPDEVADHESEEWKEVYHKLYVQQWIGDVACHCCQLSCMAVPKPATCPFCNCSTSIDFDEDRDSGDVILSLTITNDYDSVIDDLSGDGEKTANAFESPNKSAGFSLGSNSGGSIKKRTNKKKGRGKGGKGGKK